MAVGGALSTRITLAQTGTSDGHHRAALRYGLKVTVLGGPSPRRSVSIGTRPVVVGSAPDNGIALADPLVSRSHVELSAHPAGVLVRDLDSRNGTFISGARIIVAVAAPGTLLRVGDSELLIEPEGAPPEIPAASGSRLGGLIGRSLAMRRLFTVVERAAATDYTVLIEGETGTGKEVVARTLHELSTRRQQRFVVFDCAATAESLLESELFGHVRGAFTGAAGAREGAFRRAHGGTLFIDELSSLPLSMQGKLLRALESRRVHPVGADHDVDVDLRVVAATNRPPEEEMRAGRLRDDLYFRMSVVRVALPPLRQRRDDIPLLVAHLLAQAGIDGEVSGPNLDRLLAHGWPGNVRELRNVIERALALAGRRGTFADLPILADSPPPALDLPLLLDRPFKDAKDALVDDFERSYVSHLLALAGGNISDAARRAGLSRRHFFDLLKKHRLTRLDVEEPISLEPTDDRTR